MRNDRKTSRRFIAITVLGALMAVMGCAARPAQDAITQYLDERTGATVTSLAAPLVFYSEDSMLAANVRDYLYLGPIELNRGGRHEYLLWAEFCSTIDRGIPVSREPSPILFLMLDGKPMELVAVRPGIGVLPYVAPVNGGMTLMYGMTRDQLLALSRADEVRIIAESNLRDAAEYRRWDARLSFSHFGRYIDNDEQVATTSVNE
jgi:hypothetical protein